MNPSNYNPSDWPENELRRREAALRQRELELRIRELESEIQSKGQASGQSKGHQFQADPWQAHPPGSGFNASDSKAKANEPPVTPTSKYDGGRKTHWQKWQGKLWLGLQFAMIMIVVIAAINVAKWLGGALIIGMLAWVAYKVFFETD